MSPRVEKPPADNQVDLGKPAFRMGYAQVEVKDRTKEVAIEVTPREQVYKPRATVTVDLRARTRDGASVPTELAVAVLDEAVFDLIAGGRDYYDPYKGFYHLEALDLQNFNLLTQLIGIQQFAKKGASPGGDGGAGLTMRSEFKFVSYWNPSIKPDSAGKATISFKVPDNLTGWRVLAVAVTPDDRMGLGEGTFKVNQATEIRPALPNQVGEGDRFEARFTVMNRTEAKRSLTVKMTAEGRSRLRASKSQKPWRSKRNPTSATPWAFPSRQVVRERSGSPSLPRMCGIVTASRFLCRCAPSTCLRPRPTTAAQAPVRCRSESGSPRASVPMWGA
jgi:uncharacterized protein YfaS (alpha-2-macroglobulin family)